MFMASTRVVGFLKFSFIYLYDAMSIHYFWYYNPPHFFFIYFFNFTIESDLKHKRLNDLSLDTY